MCTNDRDPGWTFGHSLPPSTARYVLVYDSRCLSGHVSAQFTLHDDDDTTGWLAGYSSGRERIGLRRKDITYLGSITYVRFKERERAYIYCVYTSGHTSEFILHSTTAKYKPYSYFTPFSRSLVSKPDLVEPYLLYSLNQYSTFHSIPYLA